MSRNLLRIRQLFFTAFWAILSFFTWNPSVFAATPVSGYINEDTVWTAANSPYIVTGNITVRGGVETTTTLTIEPGTVVKFQPGTGLIVGYSYSSVAYPGALNAQGTADQPIRFTSDTITPAPGDWLGIQFISTTDDVNTILNNCEIEYAGGFEGSLYIYNASPTIENCNVSKSGSAGIYGTGTSSPVISDCAFSDNNGYAILFSPSVNPENVTGNTGSGNTHDGIGISGNYLMEDVVWKNNPDLPFIVDKYLTIRGSYDSTTTLTIEPDTVVKFQPGTGLTVGYTYSSVQKPGALAARGTADKPITFTSNVSDPVPGDWTGIQFISATNDASTILEHCVIEYGGGSDGGGISIYGASPTIKNCNIRNCNNAGIHGRGPDANPVISDNTFSDNSGYALSFFPDLNPKNVTGNTGSGNTHDGIGISGEYLMENVVWKNNPDLPFIVDRYLTIRGSYESTTTLTIEPGTVVKFQPGTGLTVGYTYSSVQKPGALVAQGTAGNPIIFTSNASPPAPGDWTGIQFANATDDAATILDHCIIEYAGGSEGGIFIYGASPAIVNSSIRNNSNAGIYIAYLDADLKIRNNLISGNAMGIRNSDTSGNFIADARYNSWGHPTGPYDPSDDPADGGAYNPDGQGDKVSDYVEYIPWGFAISEGTMLTPNVAHQANISPQEVHYFSFDAEADRSLLIGVTPQSGINSLSVASEFDEYASEGLTPRGTYELLISPTEARTYKFYVYGEDVNGTGTYSITARYVDQQYLSDVSTRSASNEGEVTLTLAGLGLSDGVRVTLIGNGLSDIAAADVLVSSPTEMYVTFDLTGVQPGVYDIRIEKDGEPASVLANAFEIIADGNPGHLRVVVDTPEFVRPSRKYTCWIEYENDGGSNMTAPLFVVSNSVNAPMRLSRNEPFREGPVQILGISTNGPAGTLAPGSRNRIPVYFQVPLGLGPVTIDFTLEKMTTDTSPIDWAAFEADVRPEDMADDLWNAVFSNLKAQLGSTWADYNRAFSRDATYLSTYRRAEQASLIGNTLKIEEYKDINLYDVRSLLRFEFAEASAVLNPRKTLASATDAYAPAPGLPLVFGRAAYQPLSGRFRTGPFGRGWSHIYEYTVEKADDGDITITGPGASGRLFQLTDAGTYQASPGDFGTLTVSGGAYLLREKNGIIRRFDSSGRLSSIEDPNGNVLSFFLSGDGLTEIRHSNGDSIIISYNGSGRIAQVTAPGNRMTTYQYDGTGEYLTAVEQPGGIVTGYAYNPADGTPSAHALNAVTLPNGAAHRYSYDEKGRLSEEQTDGDAGRITYAYDNVGTVVVTDALNQNTSVRFGISGEVLEIQDPVGNRVIHASDADSLMSRMTDPQGDTSLVAYDAKGNPVGVQNALNQLVRMSFDADNSRMTLLTDARKNETRFNYDSAGNPESVVYPDGTAETFDYDSSGMIDGYTNRRQEHIDYTVNSRGQITQKVYPNGRSISYTYDAKDRLISAADSLTGTVSMQYDARDFLTRIGYPGGYWFTFEYNNAGQRTKRTGHDGHILNYSYDATGRLEALTDGGGAEIVRYEYDAGGRLAGERKGNGTRTEYDYDPAGRLLHMINYSPGGVVQSRFDYVYDANGNRTAMTTLEGTTRYGYDDIGQLVKVVYSDGRETEYEYDDAGNRIRVTDDGVTTDYDANNMNQYTRVGSADYTYDDDGNMISKSDGDETTTYSYDAENRMVRMVSSSGETWEYTYDALGNRIQVRHDGNVKRYVHDPAGMVDVAAEYDGSGDLVARYTHAVGLVAKSDTAGSEWYYGFDGMGHTRQLTDNTGTVVNSYDYSPFGISLKADEGVENPFKYAGKLSIIEENENSELGSFSDSIDFIKKARKVIKKIRKIPYKTPKDFIKGAYLYAEQFDNYYSNKGRPEVGYLMFGAFGVGAGTGLVTGVIDAIGGPSGFFMSANGLRAIGFSVALDAWVAMVPATAAVLGFEAGYYGMGLLAPHVEDWMQNHPHYLPYLEDWELPLAAILDWLDERPVSIIVPIDPNEKSAPAGIGDQHYITAGQELPYTIYFENKAAATAPAQEVFINDSLDPNLDWTTFRLGEVAFGDNVFSTMKGKESCKERITLDSMAVDIEARIIPETGRVSWILRTIDPETGDLPEDALAGFLPPEDGNGSGQGYVTFTVRAKDNLAAGTRITNTAAIVFDTEAPINTNEVFNTVTNNAPDASATTPNLTDGATDVRVSGVLSWSPSQYATSYDLYLWKSGETRPATSTAQDLETPFYDLTTALDYSQTYQWQVVAKNVMGSSTGPVWTFTTADYTHDYLRDAITVLKMLTGIEAGDLSNVTDFDDDGVYGLPEVIFSLQKAAGVR